MLLINNKKFAKTEKEFTNSIFELGGTCVGYYKPNKKSIMLYDHNHNKIGVVCNKVIAKATLTDLGGYWYNYSMPDLIGEYSTKQYNADIENIYNQYPMPVKY